MGHARNLKRRAKKTKAMLKCDSARADFNLDDTMCCKACHAKVKVDGESIPAPGSNLSLVEDCRPEDNVVRRYEVCCTIRRALCPSEGMDLDHGHG